MQCDASMVYAVVVCLCVCLYAPLSHWYCVRMAKVRITQTLPHKNVSEIQMGSPSLGAPDARG